MNYEGLIQASPYNLTSSDSLWRLCAGRFFSVAHDGLQSGHQSSVSREYHSSQPARSGRAENPRACFPPPNSPGTLNKTDNIATNNYVSIGSSHPPPTPAWRGIDETITNNLRLFGTFVHFNNYSPIAACLSGKSSRKCGGKHRDHRLRIDTGLTQIWSPTFITEVRFGFFRNNSEIVPPSAGINVQSALGHRERNTARPRRRSTSADSRSSAATATPSARQIDNNYQTSASTTARAIGKSPAPVRLATPQGSVRRFESQPPT